MGQRNTAAVSFVAMAMLLTGAGCTTGGPGGTGSPTPQPPATVAPTSPTPAATVPPQVGAPATWMLAHPDQVNRNSTSIDVLVMRLDCSNGVTGEILAPVALVRADAVVVRADAVPLPDGAYTCPGNDAVAATVTLPEPLGDRPLVDAACLTGPAASTAFCDAGAVRWKP